MFKRDPMPLQVGQRVRAVKSIKTTDGEFTVGHEFTVEQIPSKRWFSSKDHFVLRDDDERVLIIRSYTFNIFDWDLAN